MRIPRTIATLVTLAAMAGAARATTFVAMTERDLTRAADAVVMGTVSDIETVASPDGAISTLVTIAVEHAFKGGVGPTVTLKQSGGRLNGRQLWLAGSPRFTRGERDLLFLGARHDGSARTVALGLGQFHLVTDPRTGRTTAERALDGAVVGSDSTRRLSLDRLLRTVGRAAATRGGAAAAPLLAAPPELTAPGLERESVEAFTLMDAPHGRWFEPDSGQPVPYGVDCRGDNGLGQNASLAALDGAFAAWTNVGCASIRLQRGGCVQPAPLRCDGLSQIVFNDPYHEMGDPVGCSGVLALGGFCTSSETDVVNGTTFYRITEGNVTFNNGFGSCPFWNQANLAEVATHEIGHTIGVGHSSEDDNEPNPVLKDATMYYRAHFDGRGASVHADDTAAVCFIYPVPDGSGGGSGDDQDGDGVPDAQDDCPEIYNPAQTDTDGDGLGDLCDPCPLVAGDSTCQPIMVSKLHAVLAGAASRLEWRGSIDLPGGTPPSAARALLVNGSGVVLDTSMSHALHRGLRAPSRLRYRSDRALITLRRGRSGAYKVRVVVRNVTLDTAPLISANLSIGSSAFSTSLSCSPSRNRRRLACRG